VNRHRYWRCCWFFDTLAAANFLETIHEMFGKGEEEGSLATLFSFLRKGEKVHDQLDDYTNLLPREAKLKICPLFVCGR
jgi:hypothetical protein